MNEIALNYGRMDRPESNSAVQLSTDPVAFALATCQQFRPVAESILARRSNKWDYDSHAEAYAEAVALLEPQGPVLETISDGVLEAICDGMDLKPVANGIFLSALHNLSKGNTLRLKKEYDAEILGYALAKGKTLLLPNWGSCWWLADGAEGTVYSAASVSELGNYSNSGIFLNAGNANLFGRSAEGGVYVNYQQATEFGNLAKGGMFINYYDSFSFGTSGRGHFLNFGVRPMNVPGGMEYPWPLILRARAEAYPEDIRRFPLYIDLTWSDINTEPETVFADYSRLLEWRKGEAGAKTGIRGKTAKATLNELIDVLSEIKNVCAGGRNPDGIRKIASADWQRYEREIDEMAGKLLRLMK